MILQTLVFKDKEIIKSLGRYAHIFGKSLGAGDIPQLMKKEVTMKSLEKLYPEINWDDVKLIKLKIKECVWKLKEKEY